MKKYILLFISIAISSITFAQVTPSFGVRAGLSSATLQGDAVNNLQSLLDFSNGMVTTGSRTGFFAGTYAIIPVDNMISIEPGIYYSQKGYELKGDLNIKGLDFLGANAKAKLNSDYIDIPVMLKANIDGFQLFAGPQVSYLMKAQLQTTAGVLGINLLNTTLDATNQFNRWDMAVSAGVGYQFSGGVNIMAAYDHGLSKVDAGKNLNSYNRAFKIGIGLSF